MPFEREKKREKLRIGFFSPPSSFILEYVTLLLLRRRRHRRRPHKMFTPEMKNHLDYRYSKSSASSLGILFTDKSSETAKLPSVKNNRGVLSFDQRPSTKTIRHRK